MIITSRQNHWYKQLHKLKQNKGGLADEYFMVEGEKLIEEFALAGYMPYLTVYSDATTRTIHHSGESITFDQHLYRDLSPLEETSHHCITLYPKAQPPLDQLSTTEPILILDQIQDPGNLGTLIRTARAAGYTQIVSIKGSSSIYNPKALRAATGNNAHLHIYEQIEYMDIMPYLSGMTVYQSTAAGMLISELQDIPEIYALILGNEGHGISPLWSKHCPLIQSLSIPMAGGCESLNVSIASGLLMYKLQNMI